MHNGTENSKEVFDMKKNGETNAPRPQNVVLPDPDELGGRDAASCGVGLSCTSRGKLNTAESLVKRLQQMIESCRISQSQLLRMRMFDHCTVSQKGDDSTPRMELTESRCSLFKRLRAAAGITEEQYYSSMCSSPFSDVKVEVSGKSGSIFLRTQDQKFVLKTIVEHEFQVLNAMLPHMMLYFDQNCDSLLSRFFGAYELTVDGQIMRIAVMSNVLPYKPDVVYDLKGTTEDRWVDPSLGGTLKDLNFTWTIRLDQQLRKNLLNIIRDDADFLESVGVMDYSLILGVTWLQEKLTESPRGNFMVRGCLQHIEGGEPIAADLQMGIIDFLQQWTPKKVAAHWLKKATIGCFHEIDTEPPAKYRQRFCKYFFNRIARVGD